MRMEINNISQVLNDLKGLGESALAFFVVATPLTYPIQKYVRKWHRKRQLLKFNPTKFNESIDSLIEEIESPAWKCINRYKTAIAKDMAISKLNISKRMIYKWCKDNLHVKDTKELKDSLTELLTNICKTYVDKWKMDGIDTIIVNSAINSHQCYLQSVINECVAELNRDYNNTALTMNHIMSISFIHLKMSINSLRILMDSFNGLLKDKEYKGIKNTNEHISISTLTNMSTIFEESKCE